MYEGIGGEDWGREDMVRSRAELLWLVDRSFSLCRETGGSNSLGAE